MGLLFCNQLTISGQQVVSPLSASFEQHLFLKENTGFRLDWISLGPSVNSARAEAIQLDPKHPGTIYVAFGSGGLWKSVNHGITWKPSMNGLPSGPEVGRMGIAVSYSNPQKAYVLIDMRSERSAA